MQNLPCRGGELLAVDAGRWICRPRKGRKGDGNTIGSKKGVPGVPRHSGTGNNRGAGNLQGMVGEPGSGGPDGVRHDDDGHGVAQRGVLGAGPTLAMAIAFGGTAQFVAGVVDLRKGSLFGGSAFMAYGAFWWSLVVLDYLLPKTGISSGPNELFGYFLMWTLFTLSFFVASFKVGNHLAGLFGLLLVAFLLLDGVTLGKVPAVVAGWEIFITGLVAWYIATAILVNGVYGRKVLPHS